MTAVPSSDVTSSDAAPIRLLIADDQALVRGALAALLGLEPDLQIVAQVERGDEVLEAVRASGADVALLARGSEALAAEWVPQAEQTHRASY